MMRAAERTFLPLRLSQRPISLGFIWTVVIQGFSDVGFQTPVDEVYVENVRAWHLFTCLPNGHLFSSAASLEAEWQRQQSFPNSWGFSNTRQLGLL